MKNLKDLIKVAAFDVDGTILPNGHSEFSEKTIEAFAKLKENKIATVVSTAREFSTINNFLQQLQPSYFIGANGCFVYECETQKMIYEKSISGEVVIQIYQHFKNQINGFLVAVGNICYFTPNTPLDTWFIRPNIHNYKPFDEQAILNNKVHLITIASDDAKNLSKKITEYIEQNHLDIEINSTWSKGLFISPKGVNKSTTLKYLCEYLGYSLDNLIAFGDSSNDYEMIKDSFYGVAMDKANDKIKRVAKDYALDCEYDGVYLKLKELKLI
ncbi:HAD family hydrolase [Mycoplasmopsis ciconiae]|uniref:HAD family hydrolase n=1 Tax=Mycoplasmopsis ciconiae TaxID=561067 RepID=A0ABU7MMR2_9BACT|nr:HAD family hydrolase [Mycoplasmopsis ciconiae]